MNIIVSIVLCLAMLLSGGSSLPAEPESATTWTVRNATLTLGGESVALAPEARLSAAAGSERGVLHFEIASGGEVRLPVTLDAAPDGLCLALGSGGRAYRMSAEELEKFLSESYMYNYSQDARMLQVASDYIRSYGAFIASMLQEPEAIREREEAVQALLFERCATVAGDTTLEIDGRIYPAKKLRIHFDFALIDALRDCGWPELEAMLNSALDMLNQAAGLSAESFEAFYAAMADEGGAQAVPAMPDLLLTMALGDDFLYYRYDGMDFEGGAPSGFALRTDRVESIVRPDGATASMEMTLTANGTATEITLDEVLTGNPNEPDAIDLDCAIHIAPEIEDGTEELDFSMRFDAAKDAAGNYSGALRLLYPDEVGDAALPFDVLELAFAPGSEDGATSISLTATRAGEILAGLGFELLRTEAAPVDYFAGAQIYEVTTEALESDELNPLVLALFADVSQLSLDGMQLIQEPSVQAAGDMIQRFSEELA